MEKVVGASILGIEGKAQKINELISKGVNWIHYDVMDGIFVENKSLPKEEIEYIFSHTNEHIRDVHLMVSDPIKYIKEFQKSADYITFHYEAESIDKIKKIIRDYGHVVKIGLAINPKTNVEQIYEFIPDVSHVLVMSVVPGKGGQSFMPESLDKIAKIKKYASKINKNLFIQVDGGINDQTGPLAIEAGADALVSGSFLLKNIDDKNIVKKINGELK